MKYCKDCRKRVHDYELYCPRCSGDLYARPRVGHGLLDHLSNLYVRVR